MDVTDIARTRICTGSNAQASHEARETISWAGDFGARATVAPMVFLNGQTDCCAAHKMSTLLANLYVALNHALLVREFPALCHLFQPRFFRRTESNWHLLVQTFSLRIKLTP